MLGVAGHPGRLHQGAFQPAIARRDKPPAAFPRALLVARTHACPRGQVLRAGKRLHLGSHLRQHDLRHATTDVRHLIQACDLICNRARMLLDLGL